MHVPDGFLDAPTSAATGAVAVVCVGAALVKARRELDDRTAPMAGLVAAFIFAAQMLTFPVGLGTSGHLMGGALAAVLVGPWTAILCLSVVLMVQCLLFADGGITALGTNITLMGLTTVAVGWLVFKLLQAVLPKRLVAGPGPGRHRARSSRSRSRRGLRGASTRSAARPTSRSTRSPPRWSACTS